MATVNINYLLPLLRLKIGDTTPASYRYTDAWLLVALVASIRSLWSRKYTALDDGTISRKTDSYLTWFTLESEGVIEARDEYPIVINAAIITLQGSLENNSWNLASWKDAEISYSNLESGRQKDANLGRLYEELKSFVVLPGKRLAWPRGGKLPGFTSEYEKTTKD